MKSMPEAARTCVNQDYYLFNIIDAHHPGSVAVIDFIYHPHLKEVVARTERAQLGNATLFSFLAYLVRVGPRNTARSFGHSYIFGVSIAVFHRPAAAFYDYLVQLFL